MIGHVVNVEEKRAVAALAADDFGGLTEIETVGLETARAEVMHVQIALDAGRSLEGTRTEKRTVERIEGEGRVAAAIQWMWQPAGNVAGSDSGHGCRETSVGTGREAGEHVVFSEPAWPARAFHDEFARFAVKRLEITTIVRRHFHSRGGGNVETGFVMQQDNVRKFA